jgi:hypothetical protein
MSTNSRHDSSLWGLIIPPCIWATYFLLTYATASIWCAKMAAPGGSFDQLRISIGIYSTIALAGIVLIGWNAYRTRSSGKGASTHEDAPEDRRQFLSFATLLLSVLSAVATIYTSFVLLFFRSCS